MSEHVLISPEQWKEKLLATVHQESDLTKGDLIVHVAELLGHPRPHSQIPTARKMLDELVTEGKIKPIPITEGARGIIYRPLLPIAKNGTTSAIVPIIDDPAPDLPPSRDNLTGAERKPEIMKEEGINTPTPHFFEVFGEILIQLGRKTKALEVRIQQLEQENNGLREAHAMQEQRLNAATLVIQQIREELNGLLPDMRQFATIKGATLQALHELRDQLTSGHPEYGDREMTTHESPRRSHT